MKAIHRQTPLDAILTREDRAERKRVQNLQLSRAGRIKDHKSRQAIRAAFMAYAEEHGMDAVFFAGLAELIPFQPKISDVKAPAQSAAETLFSNQGMEE